MFQTCFWHFWEKFPIFFWNEFVFSSWNLGPVFFVVSKLLKSWNTFQGCACSRENKTRRKWRVFERVSLFCGLSKLIKKMSWAWPAEFEFLLSRAQNFLTLNVEIDTDLQSFFWINLSLISRSSLLFQNCLFRFQDFACSREHKARRRWRVFWRVSAFSSGIQVSFLGIGQNCFFFQEYLPASRNSSISLWTHVCVFESVHLGRPWILVNCRA